ncbi:MAG: flagellar basal body-associated FliL family protein [Lachnospiraceae bacterium]|jgi:flagellar basal body-associated protein FliL|nr:flagellar basal body-associated FliL family protein [Lachnospiraceae bacterium]MEE3460446.1 flagellar basal body-associated FliL family protein [Lachnospiraceae bacterium]
MKKNIFTVIIMALTMVNVILTAVMFFVMMPTFQKTNNLITQVASVLNLELDEKRNSSYKLQDVKNVDNQFEATQTLNLKQSADGKSHYAMLDGYTLALNSKSEDYEEMNTLITNNQSKITDIVRSIIQSYSVDDISEDKIKQDAITQINNYLGSTVVVDVVLMNFMYS